MSDLDATASADTLIELLEQQQRLVDRISTLAERQGELIESGQSEALLELLAQRQQIMDEFLSSQDGLARLTESLRGSALAEDRRDRIGALIESVSSALSRVVRRDEQDRVSLQANRDRVGHELEGLNTAKRAQHAYVKSRTVKNRFADRKG